LLSWIVCTVAAYLFSGDLTQDQAIALWCGHVVFVYCLPHVLADSAVSPLSNLETFVVLV
jgi:hypothetical protein